MPYIILIPFEVVLGGEAGAAWGGATVTGSAREEDVVFAEAEAANEGMDTQWGNTMFSFNS
jgi:hypothetical protein